jgi:hypothetical protein
VNQLRADTELVGPVEVVLRPDDTGDVCLRTVDVTLESEHHVVPFDRGAVTPDEQCIEPTDGTV